MMDALAKPMIATDAELKVQLITKRANYRAVLKRC
jgi:hypothetical protein